MAKLSVHFNNETQEKTALAARAFNEKEIMNALRNVGSCEQLPESIKEFLDANQLPRVNAVRLMPFERIAEAEGTFYGEKGEEKVFACTVQKDRHKFPLMLLYDPEWSVRAAKKGKVEAVRNLLKKRFDLELSPELASIIKDELPDMLPAEIRFEGSKPRFEALAQRKDSTTYDMVVDHKLSSKDGDKSAWTIFIQEINVVKHFADHLVKAMALEPELAQRISEAWDHSTYVSVQPQTWSDAKQFASSMVYHGRLEEGNTVVDLLQGEIEVVPFDGRLYLDIDDELPSAIIIKGRLNVYVPPKA